MTQRYKKLCQKMQYVLMEMGGNMSHHRRLKLAMKAGILDRAIKKEIELNKIKTPDAQLPS